MTRSYEHREEKVTTDGRATRRRVTDGDEPVGHDDTVDMYEETSVERHTDGAAYVRNVVSSVNAVLVAVLALIEGLLAIRFALAAFDANRSSGFVDFIFDITYPLVRPFQGAFAERTWDEGIVEVSTLLAMGVWLLLFAFIIMLFNALAPRFSHESGHMSSRRVTHV